MLPIAAAAGLGVLCLIGVGLAMRRRRRRATEAEEVEWQDQDAAVADAEPAMTIEPAFESPAQPGPIFADPPSSPLPAELAPAASAAAPADCVDAAPGSHVEAACDGPTADNPSLSIKKRLKRAHIFDEREFLAEAGEVAPMAADAGLPGATAAPAIREPA